eukprot:s1089_g12.t2
MDQQRARFHRWLQALAGRVALLEIGCGCSEHSGEWKIPRLVDPLVRIDPGEEEEPDDVDDFVHLQLGAREGLEQLALAIAMVGSRPVKVLWACSRRCFGSASWCSRGRPMPPSPLGLWRNNMRPPAKPHASCYVRQTHPWELMQRLEVLEGGAAGAMAMRLWVVLFCQWSALVWAHGRANNPFGFNFKGFSLPGFPKGKKGASIFDGLSFFSDKHHGKFGGLPGLPTNAKKQSSGSDMLGTMCGMVPMPFVCDSTSQGVNSAECKKNPAACCGKSVKKCSDTDPFTFASPCGTVSQNAKCVGSVMTSFTKVGVCMCQGGSTCQGAGSGAKCSTGSISNIFSNLEEEDEIEAEADSRRLSLCHVCFLASGESAAVLDAADFEGKTAKAVKQTLAAKIGVTRFRLKLFLQGSPAEIPDSEVFTSPVKVQLVVLEFCPPDAKEDQEMMSAARNNDTVGLEELLKRPRNPDVEDEKGLTPLHRAAQGGHIETMRLLLEAGAEIGVPGGGTELMKWQAPLHLAALGGHLEAVRFLIDNGAQKDQQGFVWATPLQNAAFAGHLDVVRFLVESGASLWHVDGAGNTALDLAYQVYHQDVIDYLHQAEKGFWKGKKARRIGK